MSAHIETIQHVLCFDCGLDETYRWSDEARSAMEEHNAAHHSADPSPSSAESLPDRAGSTGTGNQQDGGQ